MHDVPSTLRYSENWWTKIMVLTILATIGRVWQVGRVRQNELTTCRTGFASPTRPHGASGRSGAGAQRRVVSYSLTMHTFFTRSGTRTRSGPCQRQTQLFVGLHLCTKSPARSLRHGAPARRRSRIRNVRFATVDHIVPTSSQKRPFIDLTAERMTTALERNCQQSDQALRPGGDGADSQGIVRHVISPSLGLTAHSPGMTIACGDSYLDSRTAPCAISRSARHLKVRDVLAFTMYGARSSQGPEVVDRSGPDCCARAFRQKSRPPHDHPPARVKRRVGYAYEYGGSTSTR